MRTDTKCSGAELLRKNVVSNVPVTSEPDNLTLTRGNSLCGSTSTTQTKAMEAPRSGYTLQRNKPKPKQRPVPIKVEVSQRPKPRPVVNNEVCSACTEDWRNSCVISTPSYTKTHSLLSISGDMPVQSPSNPALSDEDFSKIPSKSSVLNDVDIKHSDGVATVSSNLRRRRVLASSASVENTTPSEIRVITVRRQKTFLANTEQIRKTTTCMESTEPLRFKDQKSTTSLEFTSHHGDTSLEKDTRRSHSSQLPNNYRKSASKTTPRLYITRSGKLNELAVYHDAQVVARRKSENDTKQTQAYLEQKRNNRHSLEFGKCEAQVRLIEYGNSLSIPTSTREEKLRLKSPSLFKWITPSMEFLHGSDLSSSPRDGQEKPHIRPPFNFKKAVSSTECPRKLDIGRKGMQT
ncbi:hypothetical protein SARC_09204 [Sphaeroforma arctica JP610]|uniref:Uncharacterized protein n=1 Tax=Sphaeroforma arctica JP610 TaxID=667725 RepID=A0A0L0FNI2_9EUKA|nr:hypothetical protein SARC_09204 [Sphaeroforma arctica JP610]KNC78362.1 hypothetical protein SARC_09204 [Sphaeroforma arctica JP610]|eukprot:XP_014152264.1 hypothetical protein SARC_09204 [Sphaeroforma arctica JP610]